MRRAARVMLALPHAAEQRRDIAGALELEIEDIAGTRAHARHDHRGVGTAGDRDRQNVRHRGARLADRLGRAAAVLDLEITYKNEQETQLLWGLACECRGGAE